jgi:diguanylate cyclase (GGDEF)-like protein
MILAAAVVISFVVAGYYHSIREDFVKTGNKIVADFEGNIKPSIAFIESMTLLGERYLKEDFSAPELYGLLQYDPEADGYSLDSAVGNSYRLCTGNLTGQGAIPAEGILKKEVCMALGYGKYFQNFFKVLPEVAWIRYTSDSAFVNIYPWVSSKNFKYDASLKELPSFALATPRKDPSRKYVWTPVYLDKSGKGQVVSLLSPVYNGSQMMGVLSLDFTTRTFRRLMECDYNGYLIDSACAVISTNQKAQAGRNPVLQKLDGSGAIPEDRLARIQRAKLNSFEYVGGGFAYKANVRYTPWSIVLYISVASIAARVTASTLPFIVICVLLLITFWKTMGLKKAEKIIRNFSFTDPLTGIMNRRYLDSIIEFEMARSDRYNHPMSIITLDLDHFKKVNDTWGHPVGDEVLKWVVRILQENIRKTDILVRLGGEEFMILLTQTGLGGAREAAEKLRSTLENTQHPVVGKCTASFGAAERLEGEAFSNLYSRVDEALYRAKENGRNQVVSE